MNGPLRLTQSQRHIWIAAHLSVQHSPNSERVCVLQLAWQRAVGKTLIADQAREAKDRLASH